MIVVIGSPVGAIAAGSMGVGGLAGQVALAAAGDGATVQLIGRVGDDPVGDAVLHDLAAGGVSHVAVLRDPSRPTPVLADADAESDADPDARPPEVDADADAVLAEGDDDLLRPAQTRGLTLDAGDIELGLRYLVDFRVVVVVDDLDATAIAVVAEAAAASEAALVAVVGDGTAASWPADATLLSLPDGDDGAFARLVGSFAAGLDAGLDAAAAFAGATRSVGWEPLEPD